MRRMFYKWLAGARKVKHKRVLLQEKEQEMQKIQLEIAWDKWRGRFQEERLLPLVRWNPPRMMRKLGLIVDFRSGRSSCKVRTRPCIARSRFGAPKQGYLSLLLLSDSAPRRPLIVITSSLFLLCTSTHRLSGPSSGRFGEMPCPTLYEPSRLARWTRISSFVRRQPWMQPAFPRTHVIPVARCLEKWLQVYRTKVALRAVA